jgi:murein DD-endopeptidase MepM/ murein hydrolase activator NlpD
MRQLSDDASPRMHDGLDIAAPTGTPIQSALGGTVRHAGWIKGYGNTVIIDHGAGRSTLYAHASELLVEAGDRVERGAEIARVGSTGHSTGPHLHFEVRENGKTVDPRGALGLR